MHDRLKIEIQRLKVRNTEVDLMKVCYKLAV